MKTFFEFASDRFQPTKGEIDEDSEEYINPGLFARQLSDFLVEQLGSKGWKVEDVVVEDWGHYIILAGNPVQLAVCCGQQYPGSHLVFTEPNTPVFRRFFKKIDVTEPLQRLRDDLDTILTDEPSIRNLVAKTQE